MSSMVRTAIRSNMKRAIGSNRIQGAWRDYQDRKYGADTGKLFSRIGKNIKAKLSLKKLFAKIIGR